MLALRGSKLEVRTVTAEEAKAESESAKEAEADGSVASKETGVTGEEEGARSYGGLTIYGPVSSLKLLIRFHCFPILF